MRALLHELDDPQDGLRAVHVVGTNGKSTTTRTAEELLLAVGVDAGSTISPHVRSWSERIRVRGREVDLERELAEVRPAAERVGATQFETLTATALVAFRRGGVSIAVVEAGLGGRHDATNVLPGTVAVVLTNVSLEHTDVLGDTREAIAREKLAVVRPGATVVLGEPEWEGLAREAGAAEVVVPDDSSAPSLARAAVEVVVGHDVAVDCVRRARLPGRLEERPNEVRDGAHNPAGARWLAERLPRRGYVIVASILEDKAVEEMLDELSLLGTTLVATRSSSARSLEAARLAALARSRFARVEAVERPADALALAHRLGGPVLVTGSLYLLADLEAAEAAAAAGPATGGA